MKNIKRTTAVLLTAVMVLSMFAVAFVNAGAAESDTKIYFEVPSFWKNFKDIRLYLYNVDAAEAMIMWNSKKGKMTDEGNGLWSFDLSAKGYNLDPKTNYACIVLTNTEMQTCDLLLGSECYGDIIYCTGDDEHIESPVDSNKYVYNAGWKKADPDKYGPMLCITSIGNVVGKALPKGKTKTGLLADFIKGNGYGSLEYAVKITGKTEQKAIDDIGRALGLYAEDVRTAINKSGKRVSWDESRTVLPFNETKVTINPKKLGLGEGEKYKLNAFVSPYNTGYSINWGISSKRIADLDNKGNITAIAKGSAEVFASINTGAYDVCRVTVKDAPKSVTLNKASVTLGIGEAYTLSETTNSGSYANAGNLKWTSSNSGVVSVTKTEGTNRATLLAKKAGTANITIKTYNGKTAACKVTVKPAPASVKVKPESLKLGAGEKITISECTNSGSYANADNLYWTSSNTGIAEVYKVSGTNKAEIRAKKAGTANITIKTYNGKTATCKVTVKPAPSSVKLSASSITLNKGKTYTISESSNSGSYANAANLKWTSTNTSVATVTKGSANKAAIKAVNKGTAYIKITLYNGKTARCKVTVK